LIFSDIMFIIKMQSREEVTKMLSDSTLLQEKILSSFCVQLK